MKTFRLACLVVLCVLQYTHSHCEDFIVTNKGDAGPGTLRDAILKANANPAGSIDRIFFNLPGTDLTDRTITVTSGLPELKPGLVIDGTSQPSTPIGISDARVIIEHIDNLADNPNTFNLFNAKNSRDIWIYGIYARHIALQLLNRLSTCIYTEGAKNIHIGAPGKGNILSGWSNAIGDIPLGGGSHLIEDTDSIFIKSNILGLREDGDKMDFDHPWGYPNALNIYSIFFRQIRNVEIGGTLPGEGNIINYFYQAIKLDRAKSATGICSIIKNKIGCDANETGPRTIDWTNFSAIEIQKDSVTITGNMIMGKKRIAGISFFGSKGNKINGNFIGVLRDGRDAGCAFFQGMTLSFVEKSIVGGQDPSDKNIIGYTINNGAIFAFLCPTLTISRNSVYCNAAKGSVFNSVGTYGEFFPRERPFVTINALSGNEYRGKTTPKAQVEIFTDDECNKCDANIYLATVTADASGNWSYTSSVNGPILATSTDDVGTTSSVSMVEVNLTDVRTIPTSCGKSNGAVTGVKITSGTSIRWEDESGNVVGTDTNLVNVPPGNYRLLVNIGNSACGTKSGFYTVTALPPPVFSIDDITVTNPSCGLASGKIAVNKAISNDYEVLLLNSIGTVISQTIRHTPSSQLFPGNYFLNIVAKTDSTCKLVIPINLVNQSGASINFSGIKINASRCGSSNGSIQNVLVSGAIGKTSFVWFDSTGKVVGNAQDLEMIKAGKYQLKYKDEGSCDTIVTPFFVVRDSGIITIDTSNINILASGCSAPSGSITGIKIMEASTISWVNATSGNNISSRLDLTNVSPGTYSLLASNNLGCTAALNGLVVPPANFPALMFSVSGQALATCNRDNGSVLLSEFNLDVSRFQFWITDSANQRIASGNAASNLPAGTYHVFARDPDGCEKKLTTWTVKSAPMPAITGGPALISNDQCGEGVGSIRDIGIQNLTGPTLYRWISGTDTVGQAKNLLNVKEGTYRLMVTDAGNCTIISGPFTVGNTQAVLASTDPVKMIIPRNESANFQVRKTLPDVTYSLYEDSLGNRLITKNKTGNFTTPVLANPATYYVRTEKGSCSSPFTSVFIDVADDTKIYVPNVFTPNNDGKNDQLRVLVQGVFTLETFKIYDAWGNLVFSTADITKGWDGTSKGVNARSGSFVWTLTGKDIRGKRVIKKGTVTLIRG